ncbi:MAG: endonuclease/exonuclease/phosphatase family protein [Herpetosiphonaceae bacterium]|nr:endonuclease/exonuclease/phosphatase family protein [Herpetosiphonaceae bacterium]
MERIVAAAQILVVGYLALLGVMAGGARLMPARVWRIARPSISGVVLIYPAALLALMVGQVGWPQESGLLAVLQIFAPYLFAPLLLIAPFGLFRGTRLLRGVLAICALVFAVRFMSISGLTSPQPTPGLPQLTVLSWNLGLGSEQAQIDRARPVLSARPADVVVLAEAYWRWIENDPAITALYPYRTALYWNAETGLIILSAHSILQHDVPAQQNTLTDRGRQIVARLAVHGQPLNFIAAHPPSPAVNFGACPLICYDVADRNAQIDQLRTAINPLLRSGDPLIVAGDFNTTSREPQYQNLIAGMQEAHHEAGAGPGRSWPLAYGTGVPDPMQRFFPLIRIDHLFSSPRVIPLQSQVDCTPSGSDHCAVWGRFEIHPTP